jgi:hypothetical protein
MSFSKYFVIRHIISFDIEFPLVFIAMLLHWFGLDFLCKSNNKFLEILNKISIWFLLVNLWNINEFDSWISINPLMSMNEYDYKNHLSKLTLKEIILCIFCGRHEIKGILWYVKKFFFLILSFKYWKYFKYILVIQFQAPSLQLSNLYILLFFNLSSVLLRTTNNDQLFLFFLCFDMVFNNSSLYMSMSNLI